MMLAPAVASAATAGARVSRRWWWADPAAGLLLAAVAVREGTEAWQDDG